VPSDDAYRVAVVCLPSDPSDDMTVTDRLGRCRSPAAAGPAGLSPLAEKGWDVVVRHTLDEASMLEILAAAESDSQPLAGALGCATELRADLVSVRVPDVLEDGQRLLPGLPGPGQIPGGVTGVA
jgi:hypothetical protein